MEPFIKNVDEVIGGLAASVGCACDYGYFCHVVFGIRDSEILADVAYGKFPQAVGIFDEFFIRCVV